MEYKYKNAKVRIHGTVDNEKFKQAAEIFMKKAVRKNGKNGSPEK